MVAKVYCKLRYAGFFLSVWLPVANATIDGLSARDEPRTSIRCIISLFQPAVLPNMPPPIQIHVTALSLEMYIFSLSTFNISFTHIFSFSVSLSPHVVMQPHAAHESFGFVLLVFPILHVCVGV